MLKPVFWFTKSMENQTKKKNTDHTPRCDFRVAKAEDFGAKSILDSSLELGQNLHLLYEGYV